MQARKHGHEIGGWRDRGSWCWSCGRGWRRLHQTGSSQGRNKITTQLRRGRGDRLGLNGVQLGVRSFLEGWHRFADLRCAGFLRVLEESCKRTQLLWVESGHDRWLLGERGRRCRRRLRERCWRLKWEWRCLRWRLPLRCGADRRRSTRLGCRGYGELGYLCSDCLQRLGCNLL